MAKKSEAPQPDKPEIDPAKAAFLAALEKKKNRENKNSGGSLNQEKTDAKKSGPDAARRMFQRRSGSA